MNLDLLQSNLPGWHASTENGVVVLDSPWGDDLIKVWTDGTMGVIHFSMDTKAEIVIRFTSLTDLIDFIGLQNDRWLPFHGGCSDHASTTTDRDGSVVHNYTFIHNYAPPRKSIARDARDAAALHLARIAKKEIGRAHV